jgi:hypothetical protein
MVLTSILVVYDRCTSCGARNCIVASYPDTAYNVSTLERITRKTCSQCKHGLQIKRIKAKAGKGGTL